MSACRSEKPRIKSGFSDSILSNRALMKADTFGLLRAAGGRTVYPEMPTTRSPSPRRYNVSVVSSVRQTIREGHESVIVLSFCAGALRLRARISMRATAREPANREPRTANRELRTPRYDRYTSRMRLVSVVAAIALLVGAVD